MQASCNLLIVCEISSNDFFLPVSTIFNFAFFPPNILHTIGAAGLTAAGKAQPSFFQKPIFMIS